jgi:hypothetical protein
MGHTGWIDAFGKNIRYAAGGCGTVQADAGGDPNAGARKWRKYRRVYGHSSRVAQSSGRRDTAKEEHEGISL